ncbi:MAG TPA: DPP IV N-terminal domain-containing protein [Longimicrobiales bacterium]|nr:DPP IV N-terminal domain-containing protein [Longimicrobiales bacterium]
MPESSRRRLAVLLACVVSAPAAAVAQPGPQTPPGQVAAPTRADYDRAFALRARWEPLTANIADLPTWVDGGSRFHYRRTVPGGHEFVLVDAHTLEKRPAFDHDRLAAALSAVTGVPYQPAALPFANFRYTDDEAGIVVGVAGRSWDCELRAYTCRARPPQRSGPGGRPTGFGVVRDLEAPFDDSPRRSPDGAWEAFVRDHNLVVRSTSTGAERVLTTDGTAAGLYDHATITWSPDSRRLAMYHVVPGERRLVHYINPAPPDQLQPTHFTRLYPKPGDLIDRERPVIVEVETGRVMVVDTTLIPNPYRLTNLSWRRDGKAITFEYNERGHQRYRVVEVDAGSGAARAIIDEVAETFINYPAATGDHRSSGSYFRRDVNDGHEIIWMSERDGWRHLYLYDGVTGDVKNQITRGEYVVRSVLRVDEEARRIWFTAGGMNRGQDPYFAHAYRIDFDGSNLVPLTHADATHEISFSPDMEYYVDRYSRVDLAPVLELRRASDGALVAEIERGDLSALEAAGWRAPEVFTAKGRDGVTDIWGIIVRPTDFDPERRYPVIENIYAGPHGSFVPKAFEPFRPHSGGDGIIGMQAQAELGFVVVQIDGMGTANRSKAFHDVAWRNLGDAGFPDRILWHTAVAERYPSYDISRVGIYGASAGGQNAMGALLFHPEFYHAAVAYNGCHDNRMDKIWWNELWMGYPVGEHYSASSNVDNAHLLQGDLLLIVGGLDTNVDPASTWQVVDALIAADRAHDLLVVPGDGHATGRTTGPVEYVHRAQYDLFVRSLLGMQPPRWNAAQAAGRAP